MSCDEVIVRRNDCDEVNATKCRATICTVTLRSSSNRTSRNALAIFWIKIKTNLSFRQIGSLFNISGNSDTRRLRVADAFDSVRELFIKYFVSKHLGIGHITIDDAKIHNTAYSKEFFGNEPTLIWDGTYFFIGKSSSHSVNRSTYGGQKKRHYVKFMSIVHPDDYVSDVIGPFQGTLNDASIAEEILATNNALATWLGSNGHIIVDRGFRDVIETFQDLGYETHMPSFLKKGEKQHSTIDMNNSRMCTEIRWSVEAFHGRLKKWRIFQDKIHNSLIPKLKDIVRIVSATLNRYRAGVFIDPNSSYHQKLAQVMRTRLMHRNVLQQRVEMGTISTRSRWKKTIEDVDFDFSELSFDDLCFLFLGTYKIKLARTYVEEHLDQEGDYTVELDANTDNILRCTIQSRHSSAVKYKSWIQYSLSGDPIIAWYCTCPGGAVTIGACAHIVSIVWYLSYARHHHFEPSKGRRRIQQAIMERIVVGEDDDMNDKDQEEVDDD
ncbi:unnamed protein product [Rotaria magnacalcarata]|uniref:SWIM-type domain-containing protein n=1 Tax=Rotaria magnacalcarata TaxID=392030 RepID=A0A816X1C1_9BILA|nr:unnamed protein product [Rotaria magnacalcarata]CAF4281776.1 unnamed protein product [Rotaria magnacalcarata]